MNRHVEQVGGLHYQTGDKPQHWDLVNTYGWDYFQGQIIKYLMRWKTKWTTPEKRLEDLKKARSFLDKYIQIAEGQLPDKTEGSKPVPLSPELLTEWATGGPAPGTIIAAPQSTIVAYGFTFDSTPRFKCVKCGAIMYYRTIQGAIEGHGARCSGPGRL
jgi:hypothetical protein